MSSLFVNVVYIAIAHPCENPPTTIFDEEIPEAISPCITSCIAALDAFIPSSSSGNVCASTGSRLLISNHAGIGAP